MAFRRSHSRRFGSSGWRLKHRSFFFECGLPDTVLASDRSLNYVLHHGDDELGTGWNPSWITREQAEALVRFLREELENTAGYELLRELEKRIALSGDS